MSENTITPATFNVEDWLKDAALPEESATVYKRPDVIAELSDLRRRIELEERVSVAEKSAGQTNTAAALLNEYEALLKTFSGSALTVYVRAITDDERNAARAAHDERTKGWEPKAANEDFGYDLLAMAITHVKPAGGERTAVKLTPDEVKVMEASLGDPQMQLILRARQTAQNALPDVDADFLLKRSGTDAGQG